MSFIFISSVLSQENNATALIKGYEEAYNRANTKQEIKAAQKYLLKAFEYDPDSKKILVYLITSYEYIEEYEQALKWIEIMKKTNHDLDKYDISPIEFLCKEKVREKRLLASRSTSTQVTTNFNFSLKSRYSYNREAEIFDRLPNRLEYALENESSKITENLDEFFNKPAYVNFPFIVYSLDEHEAIEHYQKGIKDFYSFFRRSIIDEDPENFIVVIVGESPDKLVDLTNEIYDNIGFQKYAPFLGFFNPQDNLIIATGGQVGYGTLLHEMMHALLYSPKQSSLPIWKDEGFASLYERSQWEGSFLRSLPNWRLDHYPGTGLTELIALIDSGEPSISDVRMLLLFLENKQLLKDFYDKTKTITVKEYVTNKNISSAEYDQFTSQTLQDYKAELLMNDRFRPKNEREIKFFQTVLSTTINQNLDIDGKWGSQSKKALLEFQKKYNLDVDGKIGPNTKKRMNHVYFETLLKDQ
ncbi:MAG: peptidoglycan-binding domain-containing protein [Saprospiraceae bacterium]|nr:peptidoglycan-binding domain-containing protein [Saprospiraceae bacterium]